MIREVYLRENLIDLSATSNLNTTRKWSNRQHFAKLVLFTLGLMWEQLLIVSVNFNYLFLVMYRFYTCNSFTARERNTNSSLSIEIAILYARPRRSQSIKKANKQIQIESQPGDDLRHCNRHHLKSAVTKNGKCCKKRRLEAVTPCLLKRNLLTYQQWESSVQIRTILFGT